MTSGSDTGTQAGVKDFLAKLSEYKNSIDADITGYCRQLRRSTLEQYGDQARLAADAYLSVLERGGKRLRGALVMHGYAMSGGRNKAMIIEAARAIEMLHAYILIIDDIQDRSQMRRGGLSAHALLTDYHRQHELAGDSNHFGVSIALNAALTGAHAAQDILAGLTTDPKKALKVLSIINRTLLITAHGQTNDIVNEVKADTSADDVERVLEWKTAHYTFLNPLQVGMVLAGADTAATDAITEYAFEAGKAFQISDDILGTFGTEFDSGKSPMDDMREGKRTLMTVFALKYASSGDKNFLLQMLGKRNLSPAEFERCKDILVESGALDYARAQAARHVETALAALGQEKKRWTEPGVRFLCGLAQYLTTRQN